MNSNIVQPIIQRFVLNQNTINKLKSMKPQFGYNGLGEVVFRRTYSRGNEDWADVVIRVIQGVMSIRKEHFIRNSLEWKDEAWQTFAQDMAISMFEMKWLAPGRGLWTMGTDFMYERGSMSLYNCAATDTSFDFVHSVEWTMDVLMCGVGVGFNTNWRGEVTMPNKQDKELFVIPDSREGWVQSVIKLMCSYIDSPRYGKNKFPTFDYSLIRKAGEPIKGFGGISSGPEPLIKLHKKIEYFLDCKYLGYIESEVEEKTEVSDDSTYEEEIIEHELGKRKRNTQIIHKCKKIVLEKKKVLKPYSHTRLVADIFNSVGVCVVAGNVRRSAEICLGDPDDEDFMNLKNYTKNPERMEIGWTSNNSIVLKEDKEYEDFSFIPEMAVRIRDNGEPGMINLHNIQKYGRYGKLLEDSATLVNPCFSGDTLIAVADERRFVSIKQLAEEGNDVPVYSIDPITHEPSVQLGRNPRITGYNQKLLRIHFEHPNKQEYIDVTPEHGFLLNTGEKVKAKDLKKDDSIPKFERRKEKDEYIRICSSKKILTEHGLIEIFEEGKKSRCCKTEGVVVHRIDGNKSNNNIKNLVGDRNEAFIGEGNPMFGKKQSEETKKITGQRAKERFENEEYRNKIKEKNIQGLRNIQKNKCDKIIAENPNSNIVRISDTIIKVKRICEYNQCSTEFLAPWSVRERSFCNTNCYHKHLEEKIHKKFHQQVMVYKDLVEKNGIDGYKMWVEECKNRGISHNFYATGVTLWSEFKQKADDYNHRISYIEELPGDHTVYNITVDKNHTLAVVLGHSTGNENLSGVFCYNCGEISLCGGQQDKDGKFISQGGEVCNLSEVFPPRCENPEEFYQALRYATFYSSTVSLFPTHRPETNAIVAKNRRIGVSISGLAQWTSNVMPKDWGIMNYTRLSKFLRDGHKIVREENSKLAKAAGVPISIRVTTVKPSGSISLLVGVTPGVHYPVSRYCIRRVRLAMNSPLVNPLIVAGVPHEKDKYSDGTYVFEFPIDHGDMRSAEQVSPWEQFSLVALLQKHYADNCVSATVYFDKEKDGPDVEKLLAMYIPLLKSISMLPHSGHGYAQAPYEPIDRETYEKKRGMYTHPDFSVVQGNVPVGDKYCTGDKCEIGN